MGRKSARGRPLQESLLQKRRFGGILVIAHRQEIPASADMQPAFQAGCVFLGFDNSLNGGRAERLGPAT